MTRATFKVEVDWNADGDFGDASEDISGYVRDLEWRYGRDYASMLTGRSTAGQCSMTLDNQDGRFNSFLASGPLFGNLLPGRKVRVWAYVTPDQISGLHLWLKADTLTGLSTGDPVNTWSDSSGNGYNAAAITAPTYRAADGPNGKPCVRFASASSQAMQADAAAAAFSGSDKPITIFAVVKHTTTSALMAICNVGRSTSDVPYHWFGSNNTPAFILQRRDDGVVLKGLSFGTPSTSAFQIVSTVFTGTLGRAFIGGAQSGSDTDLDVGTLTVDRFGIGCLRRNTNTQFFNGDIAELIVFSRALSAAERALVEFYLSYKYQLGTLGQQWTGFLDTIQPVPTVGGLPTAKLTGTGPLGYINQRDVALAMSTNVLTGTAVGAILDDAGWPAGARSLDAGQTTMLRYWADKKQTVTALREVEETEGGGFIRETKDGKIAFEDRYHRLLSPHTVSQATYSDVTDTALGYRSIEQQDPLRELYNEFRATVQRYTVGALATLWTLSETGANSPSLQPGQSRDFWASYPNPQSPTNAFGVDAWTTPVASTDYTANTAADGSGTDLTASVSVSVSKLGNSMKITLTNNSAQVAYITLLQARGTPVNAADPVTIVSEDSASQTKYGKRTWPNPARFIPNTDEADANTKFNLSIYKDPIPVLTITLPAYRDEAHLHEALVRDVSDRVTVTATNSGITGANLGIDEDFFVEAIHHRVSDAGFLHEVTLECSPATAYAGFIVLDVGPPLDTGRLAY